MKKQVVDVEVWFSEGMWGDETKWYYKFYAYFGNSEVRAKSDISFSSRKAAVRAAYNVAKKLGVAVFQIIEAYE